MDIMQSIAQEYKKSDIPAFNVGDTVRVHIKIKEGSRERVQVFEGFVLKRQHGGIEETFTVSALLILLLITHAETEGNLFPSPDQRDPFD